MNNQEVAVYSGRGTHVQIGAVRKGNKKGTGSGGIGKDLDNKLRVNFDQSNEDVREYCHWFEKFYERTGRNLYEFEKTQYAVLDVPFIMPLPDFDAFDFAYTVNLSYPIGRSDIRGDKWDWLREPGTMQMLVYDGKTQIPHEDPQGNHFEMGAVRTIDPTLPIFNFRGKDLMVKSNMTLKMMLPYLKTAKYIKAVSTSINDARQIYDQLIWIKSLADNCNHHWNRVPLTLCRREREITKNINGQPTRSMEWMLSVEIADSDLEAHFMAELGGKFFSPEE